MYESLERRIMFDTGNMNEVWMGAGGTADAAPGMQVPANAAQWDDDPAGVLTGSQTITLSLSGLPSHTMLDAYQVTVVGLEGTFNVSIDGVAQGTMQIGIDGHADFSGGSGMEYDPSTNASHTSSSLTITLTASLSNESDQWQVYNSYISVDSYVEVSKVQDGSFADGTPGIFRFTRSNNDGPASSDQPLNVYYGLNQPVGDVGPDSDGMWVSSVDGTTGQFHGPQFVGNSLGGTDAGGLYATIPAGADHVDVPLYPTALLPPDGDMTVNCTVGSVPNPAQQVGYLTWDSVRSDTSLAAVNMANADSPYWAKQTTKGWVKMSITGSHVYVDTVGPGSSVKVKLHVPGTAGAAVTTINATNADGTKTYATISGPATMGSDSSATFTVSCGPAAVKGNTYTVSVKVGGKQYDLDVSVSY